jgi:addiction module HigA family antidote
LKTCQRSPGRGGEYLRASYDQVAANVVDGLARSAKHLSGLGDGQAKRFQEILVNEKAGISAEMAVRLSKAFGPSPDMWVRLQANHDLSQVRQDEISVVRYKRAS